MSTNTLNALIRKYHPEVQSGVVRCHCMGGTHYLFFRSRPADKVVDTLIALLNNVSIIIEEVA